MAVSGTLSTSNQYIKYKITVTEGAVDVANNTSPVTVTVNFYRTNTGYESYWSGTVYCKINGVTYSAAVTSGQKITSAGINLFSKTVTIPHNADGSKTIYVSAWISHSVVTSSEQGFNVALATIPRATIPTLSATTFDMGTAVIIGTPRASPGFTHTLVCTFGNQQFNIAFDVETSFSWTVPLTLANAIPNAASGVGSITCHTYNGSTLIGSKVISFVAKVPSAIVPIINSVVIDEAVEGIKAKFSAFVQHHSKASVTAKASGAYSSTIVGYQVTVRGLDGTLLATYTAQDISNIGTGTTIITDVLSWDTAKIKIGVKITDSRGRSASVAYEKDLLAYEAPKITTFSAFRSNASGDPDYEGQNLKVVVNFSISTLNNLNGKYYEILYKVKGASSWAGTLVSGNVYSRNDSFITEVLFSGDSAFELAIRVFDFFVSDANGIHATVDIPAAFTLVDFRASGKGIAFGKVSEKDAMEIALDVDLTGDFLQEERQTATLQNNWINYGAGYESATFWKDKCGVVHLAGLIKGGTTTAETVIFTLPEGYRPRTSEKFFAVSMNAICVIDVYVTGDVAIKTGANSGWLSLSGISFRVS